MIPVKGLKWVIALKRERVLLVHNFYQIGGGEHTVFENEKRLLKENGHYVITYTKDNSDLKKSAIKKLMLPMTMVFSLKTFFDVSKIIKRENIDIVHCHNTFPLISSSVYYAAWSCRIPVVQTIHNFRFLCPNGVLYRDGKICEECIQYGLRCGIKHGCYRNSRIQTLVEVIMLKFHRMIGTYKKLKYIFLTEFNREKFRSLLGETVDQQYIKPNFVYFDPLNPMESRNDSYVFAGRLEDNKGVCFLLDAWKGINKDLYIFGDGSEKDKVIRAEKENYYIHYMGFRQQEEIFKTISTSKALIFSSKLYEGFPMTLIETFALGTPVICTDVGNGASIVKSTKAGVIFSLSDSKSFEDALKILDDNYQMYCQNAKAAYQEYFTPEANYRQLKFIYEAVIKDYEHKQG